MKIKDHRNSKSRNGPWLCATDKVMSGWGEADNGKSYVAYDLEELTDRQIKNLTEWMESRNAFKYIRFNLNLPRGGRDDHLSIYSSLNIVTGVDE